MEDIDKGSLLGKVRQVGERLREVGGEVSRLKTEASEAVEDAVTEAKRLAKRGRYAGEDLIDDAAHHIKREPLQSVVMSLAIGFCLGALVVWIATLNSREH